jgi:hypothetical protein
MAIEWGFLILLAVVAAVADLRPVFIILVMAVGWILVVLVELLSWRARPAYIVTEEGYAAGAPPLETAGLSPRAAQPVEPLPPLLPPLPAAPRAPAPSYEFQFGQPAAGPAEEQTEVGALAEPQRPALAPDDPYAPAPERERLREAEQRVSYRLEPLKLRPRRKYRFFGPYEGEPERAEKPGKDEAQ